MYAYSVYLPFFLSTCLPIYPSTYLLNYLSIYPCIYLSILLRVRAPTTTNPTRKDALPPIRAHESLRWNLQQLRRARACLSFVAAWGSGVWLLA